jgi:hypothetical protein
MSKETVAIAILLKSAMKAKILSEIIEGEKNE